MMGAFDNEVEEVSQPSMTDLRILGFDEEERGLRQRSLNSQPASLKLPQGTYCFCDDRTLHLPGIKLNQEAASLDWTKSRSYTLSGNSISDHYEEMLHCEVAGSNSGKKLGGALNLSASARASSVAAAAYSRFLNVPSGEPNLPSESQLSDATEEPDPDDDELKGVPEKIIAEPDPDGTLMIENYEMPSLESSVDHEEPDPDDSLHKDNQMTSEPDPDDSEIPLKCEPMKVQLVEATKIAEPDPHDSILAQRKRAKELVEPDPGDNSQVVSSSNDSAENGIVKAEPDPDDNIDGLQKNEEPATAICSRVQIAFEMLKSEATLMEASSVLQTLVKIIRNVIEHPGEVRFRRPRKSNPQIQRNVVSYKAAAMEALTATGFAEDFTSDGVDRVETHLVLERNDPGLLWLAKSSLEVSMA